MTPMKSTTKRKASPLAINQQPTRSPVARRIVMIVSQSLRAHQSVNKKQTPSTMDATFEATMLKPQKTRRPPMSDDPR
jgi:hypothetical protein